MQHQTGPMQEAVAAAYAALFDHRFKDFTALCNDLPHHTLDFVVRDSGGFELPDFATVPGQKYRNLLACAVDKGDLEVARFLLDNGANPNTHDGTGDEPRPLLENFVGTAVPNGVRMFKLLVSRGADPHALVDHGGAAGATVWTEIQRFAGACPEAAALRDSVSTYVATTEAEAKVLRTYGLPKCGKGAAGPSSR